MLYAPIRLFSLGLHNYKIEKQNKQIKTYQGGGGGIYSFDKLPVCSMMFYKMICKTCKTMLELD